RLIYPVRVDVVRPVAENRGRNRGADERREDEPDDEDAARDRDPVAAEADPDLLPVAACTNLDVAEIRLELTGRVSDDRRRDSRRSRRQMFRALGRRHCGGRILLKTAISSIFSELNSTDSVSISGAAATSAERLERAAERRGSAPARSAVDRRDAWASPR